MRVLRCPRADCRGPLLTVPTGQPIDMTALEHAAADHAAAHNAGPCPDDPSTLITLETPA